MRDRELADQIKHALTRVSALCLGLGLGPGSKPNGRGRLVRCPAHGERDASCGVTIGESGTVRVKCFGCGFSGDVLALIGAVYHLDPKADFPEILQIGADLAGITIPEREGAPERPRPAVRPLPPTQELPPEPVRPPASVDEELALGRAVRVLEDLFPVARDPGIADGLGERGIGVLARAERWVALPKTGLERALEQAELAPLRSLLLKENARGEPFVIFRDHRLLIPWRRPDGRAWSFQRRFAPKTGSEDPKVLGQGTGPKPRHIPKYVWPSALAYVPREMYPYGADAFEALDHATREAWWVEGAHDVLSVRALNEAGMLSKHGTARPMVVLGFPGTQTLDAFVPHLGPFLRGRAGIVATDGDVAGQAVAAAWQALQMMLGCASSTIKPPPFKDWNLFLQANR
jgi:Toprim-like